MSDLWNNDDDNQRLSGSSSSSGMDEKDVPGRSHLGSSLIIEGVSPPLAWAESSHPFTPLGDLSSSQRFDMDAIADGGAFAVPSTMTDSQRLTPLSVEPSSISPSASITTASEPKKRRWGPKGQKSLTEAPIADGSLIQSAMTSTTKFEEDASQDLILDTHDPGYPPFQPPDSFSEPSTPQLNKRMSKSTFALKTLSGSGKGIVSGLTSLRNSIMIPALSSSSTGRAEKATGSPAGSLAASQSSILDFVTEEQPQSQKQPSASSSVVGSPSLFRSASARSGGDLGFSGKDFGETSLYIDKRHDRTKRDSTNNRSASRKGQRATIGYAPAHRSTQSGSSTPQRDRTGHGAVMTSDSAAHSLSVFETEFQQQIQKQSLFSAQKVELRKELLSLYCRRKNNERKQEEAVKMERFEEAECVMATLRLVQDRIQKLEGHYTETDRTLWKCKKRQDELGKSITEMHQVVMQELEQIQQTKEKEQEDRRVELKRIHDSEMERIQSEREIIERERGDIALAKDFLGKNEAELLSRMDEETKVEQEQLDDLKAKRNATRAEIQELTRRLEQLNQEDKEYSRDIDLLQQKIAAITQQFDGKAKDVSRGKEVLEQRSDEAQLKSQELDHQENNAQKQLHDAEATQEEVTEEIQGIISQRDRLEEVRRLFEAELATVHKLRLEEEAFREREAGWNMRASSLHEDLKKYEMQIEVLSTQSAGDQQAITDLEVSLEENSKRVGTMESLKALSVQRRDFKQAAHISSELTKCRQTISEQKAEVERLTARMNEPIHEQLEALQKECQNAKVLVRSGEAILLKEIQAVTADLLVRLETLLEPSSLTPVSDDRKTKVDDTTPQETLGDVPTSKPTVGQLSRLLLNEMRIEIEGVRNISQARYGHEESPRMDAVVNSKVGDPKDGPGEASEDAVEKRRQLEQDIQAAVAKEDYETAADLQARLDAL